MHECCFAVPGVTQPQSTRTLDKAPLSQHDELIALAFEREPNLLYFCNYRATFNMIDKHDGSFQSSAFFLTDDHGISIYIQASFWAPVHDGGICMSIHGL